MRQNGMANVFHWAREKAEQRNRMCLEVLGFGMLERLIRTRQACHGLLFQCDVTHNATASMRVYFLLLGLALSSLEVVASTSVSTTIEPGTHEEEFVAIGEKIQGPLNETPASSIAEDLEQGKTEESTSFDDMVVPICLNEKKTIFVRKEALLLYLSRPNSNAEKGRCKCNKEVKVCRNGTKIRRDPLNLCKFPKCTKGCSKQVKRCGNGNKVRRNINDRCNFFPCQCKSDIKLCSNGLKVRRNPKRKCAFNPCKCKGGFKRCRNGHKVRRQPSLQCEFAACACKRDIKTCHNGNVVKRDPKKQCEFRPCKCKRDLKRCPDGHRVKRDPKYRCRFHPCNCENDVKLCENGNEVQRNPKNNCEFDSCECTKDRMLCENGLTVFRNPTDKCRFYPCPTTAVCTQDTKVCPNQETVTRDPHNNCSFAPCLSTPGSSICSTDNKICPDGTVLSRDYTNKCHFPLCPTKAKCCKMGAQPSCRFGSAKCCLNGTWTCSIGDTNNFLCSAEIMDEEMMDGAFGEECEPKRCCVSLAKPGLFGNPQCFERAGCCPDGTWACSIGDAKTFQCGEKLLRGSDLSEECPSFGTN